MENKNLIKQVQRRQSKINKLTATIKSAEKKIAEKDAEILNLKKQYSKLQAKTLLVTDDCKRPENVIVETTASGRQIKFCHGVNGRGACYVSTFPVEKIKGLIN